MEIQFPDQVLPSPDPTPGLLVFYQDLGYSKSTRFCKLQPIYHIV
jgi:hypothetical protein